jgi:hypothetical protein
MLSKTDFDTLIERLCAELDGGGMEEFIADATAAFAQKEEKRKKLGGGNDGSDSDGLLEGRGGAAAGDKLGAVGAGGATGVAAEEGLSWQDWMMLESTTVSAGRGKPRPVLRLLFALLTTKYPQLIGALKQIESHQKNVRQGAVEGGKGGEGGEGGDSGSESESDANMTGRTFEEKYGYSWDYAIQLKLKTKAQVKASRKRAELKVQKSMRKIGEEGGSKDGSSKEQGQRLLRMSQPMSPLNTNDGLDVEFVRERLTLEQAEIVSVFMRSKEGGLETAMFLSKDGDELYLKIRANPSGIVE